MAAQYSGVFFSLTRRAASATRSQLVPEPERKTHMERFSALIGFVLILAIAWALSNNKHAIKWKTVFWGLLLQIFIAIAVLKGEPISRAIVGTNPPITRTMASLIFIIVAIIVYQIAKRIAVGARRGIWIGFTIFSVVLFVAFNLLAFLFENLKEVVNHFIAYTG